MIYVDIQNNKIVAVNNMTHLPTDHELLSSQKIITQEIASQLTRLPATFEADIEGNIVTVTIPPEPEPVTPPPTTEERLAAAEAAILALMGVKSMFEFLKVQWKLGKITEDRLQSAVNKGYITQVEHEMIIGGGTIGV